jgi:hypothetical protein
MDLDGHLLITKAAMAETRGKVSYFPAAADLAAVNRDLEDLAGGHWMPFGQKHHFMAIKGDSQEKAYNEAMAWIKKHAEEAAKAYIGGKLRELGEGACFAANSGTAAGTAGKGWRYIGAAGSGVMKDQKIVPTEFPLRSEKEYGLMMCSGARPLGTAAHAVEDSFAPMHVIREGGTIRQLLVYEDQEEEHKKHASERPGEKSAHDVADHAWEKPGGGFSDIGRDAIEAVKDLFYLVDAAVRSGQPVLHGWQSYVSKWFRPGFRGLNTPLIGICPVTAPVVKVPSQLTKAGPRHHTVKGGDSLSIIAGFYYGDVLLWPVIHDANRTTVRDPNLIQPGWILQIPDAASISENDKPALRERGRNWRTRP